MHRIEYSTQTQVEVNRAEIAAAVAAYEAAGGTITVLKGFQYVERPKPVFNCKIHSARQEAKKERVRYDKPGKPRTTPERRAEIALQLQLQAELGVAKWTAIQKAGCGKELAQFIIDEYNIVFQPKKTMKDVADQFCGVTA